MLVVVDTSLTTKWVVTEQGTAQAEALRDDALRRDDPIYAPSLLIYETTNVVHDLARAGVLTWAEAEQAIEDVLVAVQVRITSPALAKRALDLARMSGQTYAYDTQFLAHAEAQGCELWTADARFQRAKQRHGFSQVHLINSYPLPRA